MRTVLVIRVSHSGELLYTIIGSPLEMYSTVCPTDFARSYAKVGWSVTEHNFELCTKQVKLLLVNVIY